MLVVISPAKSLNLQKQDTDDFTIPAYRSEAYKLVKSLREKNKEDLVKLMNVSEKIATENVKRFKSFKLRHDEKNSKRAIDMFMGDVYRGLDVQSFSDEDYEFAQKHLRILSGLYGVLRPLDLIQPYRLEMGSRLKVGTHGNLYQFWDGKITKIINKTLKESGNEYLVNLASDEYFKSIQKNKIKAKVLTIGFKEYHNGTLKFLSFNAKVARGKMARYIIKNNIESVEEIKGFDVDRYYFSEELSSEEKWFFIR